MLVFAFAGVGVDSVACFTKAKVMRRTTRGIDYPSRSPFWFYVVFPSGVLRLSF